MFVYELLIILVLSYNQTETIQVMNTCYFPKPLTNNMHSDVHKGCIFY